MVIDQRNAGAAINPAGNANFSVDRWQVESTQTSKYSIQQNAGAVTPPVGFSNYLGVTSLSAYSVVASDIFAVRQQIEGFNTADFDWGTANAATVTVSFWVRSSLTGAFGGSIVNNANNRAYPFSYAISSANTWEKKSVTIAGDTTGTWSGAVNTRSMTLRFTLGVGSTFSSTANSWQAGNFVAPTGATSVVGTSGATFYITGVQLEKGTQATSFEYRQYGTELALCQRYYETSFDTGVAPANGPNSTTLASSNGIWSGISNNAFPTAQASFKVSKRTAPTITGYGNNSGDWYVNGSYQVNGSVFANFGVNGFCIQQQAVAGAQGTFGHWSASAEL
jgi:hypothetical protein